jgi:hypothetical protein
MTLRERIGAFQTAFAKWPASWPWLTSEQGREVLYGIWVIGNDYRNKTKFYGSFPPGLLDRIMALFPDVTAQAALQYNTLHVFSGALPASDRYVRCDLVQPAELQCSVYDLPRRMGWFASLVIADPPYSASDAVQYNTQMIDRHRATKALARVTAPGGYLVWLDTCWPMHNKTEWLTVGRILVQRSTNHRARVLSIFERVAA